MLKFQAHYYLRIGSNEVFHQAIRLLEDVWLLTCIDCSNPTCFNGYFLHISAHESTLYFGRIFITVIWSSFKSMLTGSVARWLSPKSAK